MAKQFSSICKNCKRKYLANSGGQKWCSLKCRVLANIDRSGGQKSCWPWMLGKTPLGYGWLGPHRRVYTPHVAQHAHRAAWLALKGEIPRGMFVLHKCNNPPCCNPRHLYIGTHSDNMKDLARTGFKPPWRGGTKQHLSKLNDQKVRAIRRSKLSCEKLAARYGVWGGTIHAARTGKTWKHVK